MMAVNVSGYVLFRLFSLLLPISAVFIVSESFPDEMIELKWYAACAAFMAGCLFVAVWVLSSARKPGLGVALIWFEEAVVAVCSVQAVFMISQTIGLADGYGRFTAGSFDNVAGLSSCLGVSLPLGLDGMSHYGKWRKGAFFVSKILCVAAIVLSGSRAGIICVAVCAALLLWNSRRRMVTPVLSVAVFVAVALTLTVKTDSSLGRWFIFRRSICMILEKPMAGWGGGGFASNYMNVQAEYFASHDDGRHAMLADNVGHPLNEFLLIGVEYGIIGLTVLVAFFAVTVIYGIRYPSAYTCTGIWLLVCLGVFSMFSYPFVYPFAWIMLALALIRIYSQVLIRFARVLSIAMLVVLLVSVFPFSYRIMVLREFREIQDKAFYGMAAAMLPQYARLYPMLHGDRRFLYNYSAMLFEAGRPADALRMSRECSELLADYDLCMLTADIFRDMGRPDSALASYRRAHLMCPSRFTPLYEIYHVYKSTGDSVSARRMAGEIVRKPVKIMTDEISEMIDEVQEDACK